MATYMRAMRDERWMDDGHLHEGYERGEVDG